MPHSTPKNQEENIAYIDWLEGRETQQDKFFKKALGLKHRNQHKTGYSLLEITLLISFEDT